MKCVVALALALFFLTSAAGPEKASAAMPRGTAPKSGSMPTRSVPPPKANKLGTEPKKRDRLGTDPASTAKHRGP
jgi:hypothetical protein